MKPKNWLVYQQYEQDRPVRFGELLWLDNSVIKRRGNLKTFGTSDRVDCRNEQALLSAIEHEQRLLESEGFKLIREWSFDPSTLDFALLQHELECASRNAIAEIRLKNPLVNAFALCTDHDAMTIGPIAHSFVSLEEADDDILFIPDEWSIWDGNHHFDVAYRLILSQHRDDLTTLAYPEYKIGFSNAAVNALLTLDREGVFSSINERVLMYHVSDSDQDATYFERLNSPQLYDRWRSWA